MHPARKKWFPAAAVPSKEVRRISIKHYISQYLNIIDLGGSALLFNGVNGCLDEITGEVVGILKTGDPEKLRNLSPKDINTLAKRGHITSLPPALELQRFKEFSAALHQKQEKEAKHGGIMPDYVRLLRLFKAIPYHQQTEKNLLEALSEYIIESASVSDLLVRLP